MSVPTDMIGIPTVATSSSYPVGLGQFTTEKSIEEIRKGTGYMASSTINTGAGIIVYTLIRPLKASTVYHMTFRYGSDGVTEAWMFEGTGSSNTGATQGTRIYPYNMNRNFAGTGSMLILHGIATGATSGTGSKIFSGFSPSYVVSSLGGSAARMNEIILNNGYTYLLAFSGSAGRFGWEAYWYEQV